MQYHRWFSCENRAFKFIFYMKNRQVFSGNVRDAKTINPYAQRLANVTLFLFSGKLVFSIQAKVETV